MRVGMSVRCDASATWRREEWGTWREDAEIMREVIEGTQTDLKRLEGRGGEMIDGEVQRRDERTMEMNGNEVERNGL